MIKKLCDVCEIEGEEFNEYGGNISVFGVNECCHDCWKKLDSLREELYKQEKKAKESVEDWKSAQIKKIKEKK